MHPNMKALSKATAKIPNIRDMFALTPHFLNRLLNKLQIAKGAHIRDHFQNVKTSLHAHTRARITGILIFLLSQPSPISL
jgi:hypothetical protein